jgi:hypothetical protein
MSGSDALLHAQKGPTANFGTIAIFCEASAAAA